MSTIDEAFGNEAVQMMASQLLGGNARKYDKVIYWRRPVTDPDGKPNDAPGWIISSSSDAFRLLENLARGWTPLMKYPAVRYGAGQDDSPWKAILSHPDGPAEFPVDQVLTFRWYDAARVKQDTGLSNVRFPQLSGQQIVEYDCPECNNRQYAKPVHLARHLTIDHNYDRANLIALGEQLGLSFEKEKVKDGRVERTYTYDEDFAAVVAAAPKEAPAPPDAETVAVQRVTVAPAKGKKWTAEQKAKAARTRAARQAKTV